MIKDKTVTYSVFFLCAAIMTYVVVRTFTVDITYDEYGSYLYLMHMSVWELFTSKDAWLSANNHVINTICMKVGNALFGPELPALRWGSVASAIIFLLFSHKFIRVIHPKKDWIFLALFSILLLVYYPLEFFSLARGYGMVYAMSMALMYYFIKFIKDGEDKYFLYGSITVCLGLFINLTTTVLFASWFTTTFLIYVFYFKTGILNYFKKLGKVIPLVLVTALIFYTPLSILLKQGEFEYGPARFADTLWSMYNNLIAKDHMFKSEFVVNTAAYFFGFLFIGIFFYSIFKSRTRSTNPQKMSLFLTALFLGITIVINILSHKVTGANYLVGRTSILYFPMFSGLFVYFLSELPSNKLKHFVIILFVVFSINNAVFKAKTQYCDEWYFDVNSSELASALMANNGKDSTAVVTGHPVMLMSPKFYLSKAGYKNILLEHRHINTESEFTVDPAEVKYIVIFKGNMGNLKNNYKLVYEGMFANLVRIEK